MQVSKKNISQYAMEKLSSEHKAAGHGRHCWSSRHKVGSQEQYCALITGVQWAIKGGAEDAVDFELI